jgi:hypothetical protein
MEGTWHTHLFGQRLLRLLDANGNVRLLQRHTHRQGGVEPESLLSLRHLPSHVTRSQKESNQLKSTPVM